MCLNAPERCLAATLLDHLMDSRNWETLLIASPESFLPWLSHWIRGLRCGLLRFDRTSSNSWNIAYCKDQKFVRFSGSSAACYAVVKCHFPTQIILLSPPKKWQKQGLNFSGDDSLPTHKIAAFRSTNFFLLLQQLLCELVPLLHFENCIILWSNESQYTSNEVILLGWEQPGREH